MSVLLTTLGVVGTLAIVGCSGGGGSSKSQPYKHVGPNFAADVPADLKPGKDKFEDGGFVNVALDDEKWAKDILFTWNNLAKPADAMASFDAKWHGNGAKVLEEGKTNDGKGKYLVIERSGSVAMHSITLAGPVAVECMTVAPGGDAKDAKDALFAACKSLSAY